MLHSKKLSFIIYIPYTQCHKYVTLCEVFNQSHIQWQAIKHIFLSFQQCLIIHLELLICPVLNICDIKIFHLPAMLSKKLFFRI